MIFLVNAENRGQFATNLLVKAHPEGPVLTSADGSRPLRTLMAATYHWDCCGKSLAALWTSALLANAGPSEPTPSACKPSFLDSRPQHTRRRDRTLP